MSRRIAGWIALVAAFVVAPCFAVDFVSPSTGRLTVVSIDREVATPVGAVPVMRVYRQGPDRFGLGADWSVGIAFRVESPDERRALLSLGAQAIASLATVDGRAFQSDGGWRGQREDGRWQVRSPEDVLSAFDADGRETSREDRNGNRIEFTYDLRGRLSRVAASPELAVDFDYTGDRLTAIRDRAGTRLTYRYDAGGRLTEVAAPEGRRVTYGYTTDGRLESIAEPSGESIRFTHGPEGRIARRTSSWSGATAFAYGEWTRVTRSDGYWTETRYDGRGDPLAMRDSLGTRQGWSWNGRGQLESQTFADGSTMSYAYDADARLVRQMSWRGDALNVRYDGRGSRPVEVAFNGAVTRFEYDAKGNLVAQRTPAGRSVRYGYDALGRRTAFVDGAGRTTRYEYDAAGRTVKEVHADGGEWTWAYDAAGRLQSERDAEGNATAYRYTAQGFLASITGPGTERRSFEYDASGRLVSETRGTQITRFYYEPSGRPSGVDLADGSRLRIAYDAAGRVARVTDGAGHVMASQFDGLGRVVATMLPSGVEVSRTFAPSGALASLRVGESRWTLTADRAARATHIVAPDGATVRVTTDAFGRPIALGWPGGGEEHRRYDADGLLESIVSPLGEEWRVAYGRAGDPTLLRLPDGTEHRFDYDAAGRIAGLTYPWGSRVAYRYDRASRIVARSAGAGMDVAYEYDAAGRLTGKRAPGYAWTYRYDPDGRMTEAAGRDYVVRFAYDGAGRVVRIDYPQWRTHVAYTYDAAGRRATRTDPDGAQVRYGYDGLGRLATLEGRGQRFAFGYDAQDRLSTRTASNGITLRYAYDGAGRVVTVSHVDAAGKPIAARRYRYDAAGNRVEATDERGRTATYRFDLADQLLGERMPGGSIEYRLGPAGQRSGVLAASGPIPYRYDRFGRLVQAGDATFEYDAQGNLATRRDAAGTTRYAYDVEGRLTRVNLPAGNTVSFGYGPFGERLWRDEDGKRTHYVYDGDDLLAELSEGFESRRSFVYGGLDRPLLATSADGGRAFYHGDDIGTVVAITDGGGRVTARYDYDAFGNVVREEGAAAAQPLRFAGRPFDPVTKLYDLRARFYDPRVGRFISPDPVPGDTDDPMSLLPYVYARNNPLGYVDPFGTQSQPGPVEMAVWWGLRYAKPGVDVRWPWVQGELAGYALRANLRYPPPPGAVKPNSPFWKPDKPLPQPFAASPQSANLGVTGGFARPSGDTVVVRLPQPSLAARTAAAMRDGATRASAALQAATPQATEVSRAAGLANSAMALGDMVGEVSSALVQGDDATAALGDAVQQLGVTTIGGAVVGYGTAALAPLVPAAAGGLVAVAGAAAGGAAVVVGAGSRVVALAQELGHERVEAPQRERAERAQEQQQRDLLEQQDALLDGLRGRLAEARALASAASAMVEEIRDRKFDVANVRNRVQALATQAAAAKERAEKAAQANAGLGANLQRYALAEAAANAKLTEADNAANDACVALQNTSPTAEQASAALAAARQASNLAAQAKTSLPVPLDFDAAVLLAQDAQSPIDEYESLRARAATEIAKLDGLFGAMESGAAKYDETVQKSAGLRDDAGARARRLMLFDELKEKAAAILADAQALTVPSGEAQALVAEARGLAGEARAAYGALTPLPAAASAQAGQDLSAMRGRFAALRQRADSASSRAVDCAQRVAAAARSAPAASATATDGTGCAGDVDCPLGLVCGPQKVCITPSTTASTQVGTQSGGTECRMHSECPSDSACVDGKCVKSASPADVVAGFDRGDRRGAGTPGSVTVTPGSGGFRSDTLAQEMRDRETAATRTDRGIRRDDRRRNGAPGPSDGSPIKPGSGSTGAGVDTPSPGTSTSGPSKPGTSTPVKPPVTPANDEPKWYGIEVTVDYEQTGAGGRRCTLIDHYEGQARPSQLSGLRNQAISQARGWVIGAMDRRITKTTDRIYAGPQATKPTYSGKAGTKCQ